MFERRGGEVAREAAARFLGGDTSAEAASAWREHAQDPDRAFALLRRFLQKIA